MNADEFDSKPGAPVFNLKDAWSKVVKK